MSSHEMVRKVSIIHDCNEKKSIPKKPRMTNKELALAFFDSKQSRKDKNSKNIINHRKCIEHFSKGLNVCNCCGDNHIDFLTLSHVNHDGWIHKMRRGGEGLVSRLIKDNFETEYEIVVECYNCNLSRNQNGGKCPHEEDQNGS